MVAVLTEEQIAFQKEQEARSFVGKNGPKYVLDFATKKEREHFEGILYHNGVPMFHLLSYLTSTIDSF